MSKNNTPVSVQRILLSWFKKHGRDLPWRVLTPKKARILRDPYRVLVSELMLQQTQVSRVIPKYTAFVKQWPTFMALSHAKQSDVIVAWAGLGYNRRAIYLWRTACEIRKKWGGNFPTDQRDIEQLPGIGPYTSRALRVFALGEQTYMVDTNIRHLVRRVFLGDEDASEKDIEEAAARWVPKKTADAWHQCLMDFGSAVCLSAPRCDACPLASACRINIQSKKKGFASFSMFLASHPKEKRGKSLPFPRTDRYFRGRIIDVLRSGSVHMEALQNHICKDLGLTDRVRFGNLIEALMGEQMIMIKGSMVMLKD